MVGGVVRREIHGHTPYQRDRPAVKTRLAAIGQRHRPAIGIAHAEHRDPARPRRPPGGVVADAAAGRQVAHLQHPRPQRRHRPQRMRLPGGRVDAGQRRPRPRQVGDEVRPQEQPGRVGKAAARRRQQRPQRRKPRQLLPVQRIRRQLRRDQMRHQVADLDAGQPLRRRRQPRHIVARQAEPGHAGIQMQQRRRRVARAALDKQLPARDLVQRAEHRRDGVRRERRLAARRQAVQHRQHDAGQMRAQRQRLAQMGHEEMPAALRQQPARHRHRTQPVAIRLDHRRDLAAGMAHPQRPPVGGHRAEVDGQFRKRVRRHQSPSWLL